MALKFMNLIRSKEPEDRFLWGKDVRVKVKAGRHAEEEI
jgi:hypothetical protein